MDERNEIENDVKVDAVTSKGRKAVIILISLLILYTLYHVCMGLTESVKTTPAGLVEQSSSVVFEGVIYRNEEVISTKNKGDM